MAPSNTPSRPASSQRPCKARLVRATEIPKHWRGKQQMTIDLHTWNTPELPQKSRARWRRWGLPYSIPVNIPRRADGRRRSSRSPNNKIPGHLTIPMARRQRVSVSSPGRDLALSSGEKNTGKFLAQAASPSASRSRIMADLAMGGFGPMPAGHTTSSRWRPSRTAYGL